MKWRLPSLGFDVSFISEAPFVGTPAMRVEHQAKFHPRKYLRGLLTRLRHVGCEVFEESEAEIGDDGVKVGSHTVRAPWVVVATHNPLQGHQNFLQASLLQTKLAHTRATSFERQCGNHTQNHTKQRSSGIHSPYHYLRLDNVDGETFAIAGGADHKTGQVDDPARCYTEVEAWLTRLAPGACVTERWSGQVVETADFLPIIGTVAERQFIATGFAGTV